jgi:hypothetical protein
MADTMNASPNVHHKTVPGDELDRLLRDNPDILVDCEIVITAEEENDSNIMHRTFCCKSSTETHLDIQSHHKVAVFLRNDYVDGRPPARTLLKLRIGDTVYDRSKS